jgi:SAM-dependent methyltransferase
MKPYIPASSSVSENDVWAWYGNIDLELKSGILPARFANYLGAYYREAGLLRWHKRPFFRFHFSRSFANSAVFLLDRADHGTIVDLGCGCGMQSLYLALRGARVIALDLDQLALNILERRKEFYEEHSGKRLDVAIHHANALEFDYSSVCPIAGLHSLFAFNMMQPSSALVDRIVPCLSDGARWAIQDGNNRSWMARYLPWRRRDVWSPLEFCGQLAERGFKTVSHHGGVVLPPLVWRCLPYRVCTALDRALAGNWFFPISHHILAEHTVRGGPAF